MTNQSGYLIANSALMALHTTVSHQDIRMGGSSCVHHPVLYPCLCDILKISSFILPGFSFPPYP